MNTVKMYKDIAGEYRWKVVAANNKIVAVSGEGYINKDDCEGMAKQLFMNYPIEDETENSEKKE